MEPALLSKPVFPAVPPKPPVPSELAFVPPTWPHPPLEAVLEGIPSCAFLSPQAAATSRKIAGMKSLAIGLVVITVVLIYLGFGCSSARFVSRTHDGHR
jgi:hypothetical protein